MCPAGSCAMLLEWIEQVHPPAPSCMLAVSICTKGNRPVPGPPPSGQGSWQGCIPNLPLCRNTQIIVLSPLWETFHGTKRKGSLLRVILLLPLLPGVFLISSTDQGFRVVGGGWAFQISKTRHSVLQKQSRQVGGAWSGLMLRMAKI